MLMQLPGHSLTLFYFQDFGKKMRGVMSALLQQYFLK